MNSIEKAIIRPRGTMCSFSTQCLISLVAGHLLYTAGVWIGVLTEDIDCLLISFLCMILGPPKCVTSVVKPEVSEVSYKARA